MKTLNSLKIAENAKVALLATAFLSVVMFFNYITWF